MQETDMREKLEKIIRAYEDLQGRMGDPAVLADQKEYNRLAKEYASQGPLAAKAREYVQATDDLAAAKEMLEQGDLKVYEIAEKLGYESAFYFSKVFKKVTGLSPREYQQSI